MANKSREIINLALRKVEPGNKIALLQAQEAIKKAMESEFVMEDLIPFPEQATTAATNTSTEVLPKLVANPWQPWRDPITYQPRPYCTEFHFDLASGYDDTAMAFGLACFGICQPSRPEVLRKTVNSRVVEPLGLPAPKEQ